MALSRALFRPDETRAGKEAQSTLSAKYASKLRDLHMKYGLEEKEWQIVDTDHQNWVAVHSLCDSNFAGGNLENVTSGITERNHKSYAERWGYEYTMHTQTPLAEQEPQFGKLQIAIDVLSSEKPPDWFLWLDCDALVTNRSISVESLLRTYQLSEKDFVVAEEVSGINSGVFLVRGGAERRGLRFLEEAMQSDWRFVWDQTMLLRQMAQESDLFGATMCSDFAEDFRWAPHFGLVPQHAMNLYGEGSALQWGASAWKPGDFILHLAGCPLTEPACMLCVEEKAEKTAEAHAARLLEILQKRDAEMEAMELQTADVKDGEDGQGQGQGEGQGLEQVEAMLVAESEERQNPMVLELLKDLQKCAVYTDTPNHETNRKLWDAYAQSWSSDVAWVQRMSSHVSREAGALKFVGDEWSDVESLDAVLSDWLYPHLEEEQKLKTVAEVGSGGGRIAARVAPKVERLVCFDVSDGMLARASSRIAELGHRHVEFRLVHGGAPYPEEYHTSFDFVYSFDVFVHMDLHQMRQTLHCIRAILRPGGFCFISFANLLAPDGWQRFAKQQKYSVGGFYFVSPDIVRCLLTHAGFSLVRMSKPQAGAELSGRDKALDESAKQEALQAHLRWLEESRAKLQEKLKAHTEQELAEKDPPMEDGPPDITPVYI
ncbi:putative alpha-1,2-galactosyltransferase [Symbiodinium microadriaticum]|uniref:Putative alpha-1,2-galactosyltransferase n=1 Tax=Symbiodinium microadriaticum TaxID=2951 RepID=A0A1Q9CXF6_SYMMI|nr:putative alpha-1,2-galactosyltransferase [Symbiodinium microadriaticum]